jgi:hypothetical protein
MKKRRLVKMKTGLLLFSIVLSLGRSLAGPVTNLVYDESNKVVTTAGVVFSNLNASILPPGVSNGTSLVDLALEFVTPDMFGAVADNKTDNTAALQRWLDYLSAHNQRTRGWIPNHGIYAYGSPIFATAGSITIEGAGEVGDLGQKGRSGSMLRYTGATGYAMVIGHTNDSTGSFYLRNFRLGTIYRRNPAPDGLLLQNTTVGELYNIHINGGFNNGLTIIDSTLIKFRRLTIQACTNAIVLRSNHRNKEFPNPSALTFTDLNLYTCRGSGFLIQSTAYAVSIHDSWIESVPYAFHILPLATEDLVSVHGWYIKDTQVSTHAYDGDSRLLLIDFSGPSSFFVDNFVFRDGWSFTEDSKYAVEIHVATNKHDVRAIRNIAFDNWNGWGAQNAMVTNDWPFTKLQFTGSTETSSGYGGKGVKVPLRVGPGYRNVSLAKYDYTDAWDSGPWRLPTNNAATPTNGLWMYDAASQRPRWHDGTTYRQVASTSDIRPVYTSTALDGTTIDCRAADAFLRKASASESYTFTNKPKGAIYQTIHVRIFNSSGGAITPAFAGAKFPKPLSAITQGKYGEYTFWLWGQDGEVHGTEHGTF